MIKKIKMIRVAAMWPRRFEVGEVLNVGTDVTEGVADKWIKEGLATEYPAPKRAPSDKSLKPNETK